MRRNKLFAAVLASTMLTTSILSPMGNLTVRATEVVNAEYAEDESEVGSDKTEVTDTESASSETEVEGTESVSNKTEVEGTESANAETEVDEMESVITETEVDETKIISNEIKVMDTENVNVKPELTSEDNSMASTEVENADIEANHVNTETSNTENEETESTDTETTPVSEETESADSKSIILDEKDFPDAEFYRYMLVFADSNEDDKLTVEEAAALKRMDLWSSISDIRGIEYCTGLESLSVTQKEIIDISFLADLTNLTSLNLSYNQITDISVLKGLTNLTSLSLNENQITDISVLADLTNLTSLSLWNNQITDISALKDLTNLTSLDLSNNQIADVNSLTNLINLTSLYLDWNQITDLSPLADLVLKHNLKNYSFRGNTITNIGKFPEYVEYDEEVEIRYLAEADKKRMIEILGLSEYDGKVICIDSEREWGSFRKFSAYGSDNSGYGKTYEILRKDNGDLTLGYALWYESIPSSNCFKGDVFDYTDNNVTFTICYEGNNVWFICCGDADASGLEFTDKIEKTKVVEPFAKNGSGETISKSFEREFGEVLAGTLSEQDVESVVDYFGFDSYSGDFAIIPTEGAEYTIDFEKSSYGKDELYKIDIIYYSLTRDENGSMDIEHLNSEWYGFQNGKLSDSLHHSEPDEEIKFLTKGDIGTDIEDCVFYIPTMDENSDEVILTFVKLYMLNERSQGNLMVYNDEKTLEVCNFTEVKEPEEDSEENMDAEKSYQVVLPSDNPVISKDDFTEILEENKTKDVVIQSNNGVSFTFKAGTMSAIDGAKYDFGTELISDLAKAGDMGESVTKDNFITRINYNYEGKLPAKASIRFYVGSDLAGKTLHYSHILENGFKHLQSVVVDKDGYITVTQDHCSDYVVTTEKLDTTKTDDTNKTDDETISSPATGDNFNILTYVTMFVFGAGTFVIAMRKRKVNN